MIRGLHRYITENPDATFDPKERSALIRALDCVPMRFITEIMAERRAREPMEIPIKEPVSDGLAHVLRFAVLLPPHDRRESK